MRKTTLSFSSAALLLALLAQGPDAQAQFWNKLFGKQRRSTVKPVVKPAAKPAGPAKLDVKKKEFVYPPSRLQQRYRIDVFAPLYLAEVVPDGKPLPLARIPDRALQGLQFYAGLKLAADTLQDAYPLDIYVHDAIDAEQSPSALLVRKELENTDLIIGALAASQLNGLAAFAEKHSINFVSVLSPSDGGIRDNPFFIQLQPTLQIHCEALRQAVLEGTKNRRKPILAYRSLMPVDASARRMLLGEGKEPAFQELLCNVPPTAAQWRAIVDTTGTNTVVLSILDQPYAERLLRDLLQAAPKARFEVYVMPTWKGDASLRRPDAFPNTTITYTSPSHFDAETPAGAALARSYQSAYGTTPGEMAFRGFETLQWCAYLLNRYGTVFNPKMGDSGAAGFTRFDVKLQVDKTGKVLYCENRNLYRYRYTAGSYTVSGS